LVSPGNIAGVVVFNSFHQATLLSEDQNMIKFELLINEGVLMVTPEGPLASDDFKELAAVADPYIEQHGKLNGLMIYTESFPGWKDFEALVSHFRFVKDHHRRLAKLALVTDSKIASFAETMAKHFVSAEIKHFDFNSKDAALNWLIN
jgi:hypothetical protein